MKLRVIIFVVLALITLLCCQFFSHPPSSSKIGVVVWLPETYDNFSSKKIDVSEEEKRWLPGDTTNYKRVYFDKNLSDYLESNDEMSEAQKESTKSYYSLNATLIVAGADSRSLHNPVVCLTAQAWTIDKKKVTTLQTEGGALDVMNLYLKRAVLDKNKQIVKNDDGSDLIQRAIYTYWWIGPNDTTPHLEKKTWLSLWNSVFTGEQERWAYPSIMTFAFDKGGIDDTQKRIDDFIIRFAPSFQRSLGAVDREDAIVPYEL